MAERVAAAGELRDQGKEAAHRLRNGLIALAILVALVVGLLLAVPGLSSVKHTVKAFYVSVILLHSLCDFLIIGLPVCLL